jgi:Helix-turn-helix domain
MALRKFRIVGGREQDRKSLDAARRRARPLLRYWLRKVERAVIDRRLLPIDYLLAKELTNYPSANDGRCYAGQKRLAGKIGRSDRTARQSLKRLCGEGLLKGKRGGPARTASWSFCFAKTPIFDGTDPAFSAQDRKSASGLDRKSASAKPSEPKPIEHKPPPTRTNSAVGTTAGLPMKVEAAIDGEVILGLMSFQEFWLAAGRRGHEGFARAQWRKLSFEDKAAITDRLQRDGGCALRDLWAGVWLRDRVWKEQALPPPRQTEQPDELTRLHHVQAGSALWMDERERLLAAGRHSMVKLMDDFAAAGRGWTVRR